MSLKQHRPSPTPCLCGGTADAAPDTAMTEIALALAMAFFSLMVLAMMSMAVPSTEPAMAAVDPAETVALAAVSREPQPRTADRSARRLIIHYAGRLWTSELAPFDLGSEAAATLRGGPVVLAVAPDLPLGEAVALRQGLAIPDLVVSTLDEPWLARLREQFP